MINVVISGLPGKMATAVTEHLLRDRRFDVLSTVSLTGPDISELNPRIEEQAFILNLPDQHKSVLTDLQYVLEFIIVDYSQPSAVNQNAELYCELEIPFVMGTTGGDRKELLKTVKGSNTCAVISPNMSKQIVGFLATMKLAAENLPGLFRGYTLEIVESHQAGKKDTSGTAKEIVEYFNELGIPFKVEQIKMVRDPEVQALELRVPIKHLKGHGWHSYTLRSEDGSVLFRFTHNVNGRDTYALGTIDALLFLKEKIRQGKRGEVYSMIDVIKE